ncbi:MAG: glycosyl hydrolase [Opitutaceae bacterium]|nr:glycosyl hydrolase [Opitutaceae bacterium]
MTIHRPAFICSSTVLALLGCFLLPAVSTGADNAAAAKKLFAHPPREYSTAPLWVWNDQLTPEQIRGTMQDLAGQQVRQVFVHPRPGLMTPYLSPEWFQLWKVALVEAARLDMNVWIYDENSYPSGFAGGWVPELMPESRGRGLHFKAVSTPPAWEPGTLAAFKLAANATAEDVSAAARSGTLPAAGRYLVATIQRAPNRGWHGDRSYVDLLYPGVTEKFLDVTLAAYRRQIGHEFGKRVPGAFTDEPEIRPAGGLPWTDDLPRQFDQRWGYSLTANLAALNQETGDWRKMRHNYFHTLNQLFIERWGKPYYDWCEKNGLAFTGHYWDHEWPKCGAVPSNMAIAAWQHIPGIDCLMNQYREDTNAQFGNVRFVRELASVANQLGRKRRLCEIYGAGGWDLRFEDMKRIGDWLGVLGVNLFDEHLSYISLRGARKRDHPQSFSYHEPWWDSYHVNATYLTRLAFAMSQGEQVNHVLVLEPTTTAWMYQGNEARLKTLGSSFFNLLMGLESAQVEYDLGDEDIIARHASSAGRNLKVGQREYTTVVLPVGTENLDTRTVDLLESFLKAGGTVLACDEPPVRVDGGTSGRVANIARTESRGWRRVVAAGLPAMLGAEAGKADGFAIARQAGDKGILFHQRRQLADGELLLLVNTSIEHRSGGSIQTSRRGIEAWGLNDGKVRPYPFLSNAAGVETRFDLPPSGSLLLFLSRAALKPAPARSERKAIVAATGPMEIRRVAPNVLTLDHVDITAGGETKQDLYFYQAGQFAFQKNGMERNPWDSAVQFRDELIKRTFPANSGFEASYRFTIEGAVPAALALVIERPDLYAITCNGAPVTAQKGKWWLDRAFGRIDLSRGAKPGENVVTIKATPFTLLHELEPAYVLGEFALRSTEKGFVITAPQPLKAGFWNEQGLPFYADAVAYRSTFQVGERSGRSAVVLSSWRGSVAKVLVNGKLTGTISAPPWECDVTDALKTGANRIEVQVIGTLKNTLGPHHGNPALGAAWPRGFQLAPKGGLPAGAAYSTIGYGVFEPFVLKQTPADGT